MKINYLLIPAAISLLFTCPSCFRRRPTNLFEKICDYYLIDHPEEEENNEYAIWSANSQVKSYRDTINFVAKLSKINVTKISEEDIEDYARPTTDICGVYYYGYTEGRNDFFVSLPHSNCNVILIEFFDSIRKPQYEYYAASQSEIDSFVNYCLNA